jgi:hypothetical protein
VSEELEVLRVVVDRLKGADVSHMLTGSVAMAWYAQPRQTRDIDIVVDLPESKIDVVVAAFSPDFYIDRDMVLDEVRRHGMFNMIEDAAAMKVDMIIRKDDSYASEAFQRRRSVEITHGLALDIISAEDLVLSKLAWAKEGESDLQLRDVRNLLRSVADLDRAYVTRWAGLLGLSALLEKATPP